MRLSSKLNYIRMISCRLIFILWLSIKEQYDGNLYEIGVSLEELIEIIQGDI